MFTHPLVSSHQIIKQIHLLSAFRYCYFSSSLGNGAAKSFLVFYHKFPRAITVKALGSEQQTNALKYFMKWRLETKFIVYLFIGKYIQMFGIVINLLSQG